jgi:hypothetical protein
MKAILGTVPRFRAECSKSFEAYTAFMGCSLHTANELDAVHNIIRGKSHVLTGSVSTFLGSMSNNRRN